LQIKNKNNIGLQTNIIPAKLLKITVFHIFQVVNKVKLKLHFQIYDNDINILVLLFYYYISTLLIEYFIHNYILLGVQKSCEFWISYNRNNNFNFIYLPALCNFKGLIFGLLTCHGLAFDAYNLKNQ